MTVGGWLIFAVLVVFVGGPMVVAYHRGHVEIQRRHAESRAESFALDVEVVPFDPDLAEAGLIEPRLDWPEPTLAEMSTHDLVERRADLVDQVDRLYYTVGLPGQTVSVDVLRRVIDDVRAVDDELRHRDLDADDRWSTTRPTPVLSWVREVW